MINPMNISELKHYVEWQFPAKVSDGMGGSTTIYLTACNVWARILPTSAKELRQSDQQVNLVSHTVRIRYRSVFKSNYRMKYKNRYFAIVSIINPEESNLWLDINLKEVSV
jgi:SPP1 family predicted phage head-tail adaptor